MQCPKCKSENVNTILEQASGKTKNRNMGCLWAIGRFCLIFCTGGLWLLVGKRKRSGNIKFKNETVALCQNCGYKWKI
ncbi:hypothetical protein [Clostridium sp.]|uniref:hypothetical protein n=1 Tax=Clostridium sp. TaxID=1506 RepID=UPI001A43804C|nr:hypothetical protein [Clostridium sp.]MBK5243344.1 hypothetical protein [Clostridium sp.]